MNIVYRWFPGYPLNEPVPHFTTIRYYFRHRFTKNIIKMVFAWILFEIQRSGYLFPETVYIDSTHIKANANIKKTIERVFADAKEKYVNMEVE